MSNNDKFNEKYSNLNAPQKDAVDSIDGPVMVIAGPGTGKTSILTLRIANILLKTDTKPENILALTFTDSGVKAMRQKLIDLIGSPAYDVGIFTFHSFAEYIFKKRREDFPELQKRKLIEETKQYKIIEEILSKPDFEKISTFYLADELIKNILGTISDLKRELIDPDQYRSLIAVRKKHIEEDPANISTRGKTKGQIKVDAKAELKKLEKDLELAMIYESYEKALIEANLYDYNDMINFLINKLEENEDLLRDLQETYLYVLADEHQDANASQNKILKLLISFHENPNIFIVGDEKQSIFRFQGASLENFGYFKKEFGAKIIKLENNYRSNQRILDRAFELISNNPVEEDLRVELKAHSTNSGDIFVHQFENQYHEIKFIVDDIKEKLSSGISPDEIAVISKKNARLEMMAEYFEAEKIPFSFAFDKDLLEQRIVKKFLNLIRAINNPRNNQFLSEILFLGVFNLELSKIYDLIDQAKRGAILFELIEKNPDFEAVFNFYKKSIKSLNEMSLYAALISIFNDSKILEESLSHKVEFEKVTVLNSLFNLIRKQILNEHVANLDDLIRYFDTLIEYSIRIDSKLRPMNGTVRLMTAHKSKGLEFDHVYIFDATESTWTRERGRMFDSINLKFKYESKVGEGDNRRLFYVAVTRARDSVIITYSQFSVDEREMVPTKFISELNENLIIKKIHDGKSNNLTLPVIDTKNEITSHDRQFLQNLFLKSSFSVTALNNYFECPRKYFFESLLKLPRAENLSQIFGIITHSFLELAFNKTLVGEKISKTDLQEILNQHKNKITPDELEKISKKVSSKVSVFAENHYSLLPKEFKTEYSISDHYDFGRAKIKISGKIDRVDYLSDGIRVVDYKTGSFKKAEDKFLRQLAFYKLFFELMNHGDIVKNGILYFVTDDKNRSVEVELDQEKLVNVKNDLTQTLNEIYDLKFLDKKCEDKNCKYCFMAEEFFLNN